MAHSPLKMLKEFHDKRVLVSGQGPIREISKNLGFTNMCTVENIQEAFPVLDVVDHRKLERLRARVTPSQLSNLILKSSNLFSA